MISSWYKNKPQGPEQEQLIGQILGSKIALQRLDELLQEETNKLDRSEMDPKVYDTGNWAALQAHKNGQRAALQLVRNLIDLDQKDK